MSDESFEIFSLPDTLEFIKYLKEKKVIKKFDWILEDDIWSAGTHNDRLYLYVTFEDDYFTLYAVLDGKESFWEHSMKESDLMKFKEIFEGE